MSQALRLRESGAVAALLFDRALRPSVGDLVRLAAAGGAFAVLTHESGRAELLRDGLTVDCDGLAPAPALGADIWLRPAPQLIDLAQGFDPDSHAALALSMGAPIAGAGHLLPVVRMLAGIVLALAELPGACAIAWVPANLIMTPQWFIRAVGVWLRGGPFPALAMTGLARSRDGFASRGLAYFIGQEFILSGKGGIAHDKDARGAIRLTDWLIAHGRVDSPREVHLHGFGPVSLEPDGQYSLKARIL